MNKINNIVAGEAIVSTGKNNYGHPKDSVRVYLCSMKFALKKTDWEMDDIIVDLI